MCPHYAALGVTWDDDGFPVAPDDLAETAEQIYFGLTMYKPHASTLSDLRDQRMRTARGLRGDDMTASAEFMGYWLLASRLLEHPPAFTKVWWALVRQGTNPWEALDAAEVAIKG